MVQFNIGHIIKELRLERGLSQNELCEGICDQSFISRIEKEKLSPSASMLYLLSLRLGVEINYFFDFGNNPRKDYAILFCEEVRTLVGNSAYTEVKSMLKSEKRNPFFSSLDMKKFITWNEGLCLYYVDRNIENALSTLHNALAIKETILTIKTVADIEIMNSIANIYNEENLLNEAANWYDEALTYWNNTPSMSKDHIYIRIIYNYSVLLSRKGKFRESISLCDKGISHNKKTKSNYLLAHLLYEKGLNLKYLEKIEMSKKFILQAISLFEIQEESEYVKLIKSKTKGFLSYNK